MFNPTVKPPLLDIGIGAELQDKGSVCRQ